MIKQIAEFCIEREKILKQKNGEIMADYLYYILETASYKHIMAGNYMPSLAKDKHWNYDIYTPRTDIEKNDIMKNFIKKGWKVRAVKNYDCDEPFDTLYIERGSFTELRKNYGKDADEKPYREDKHAKISLCFDLVEQDKEYKNLHWQFDTLCFDGDLIQFYGGRNNG